MSDRELLELAAKAAGHKIVEWTKDGNGVEVAIIVQGDGDGFSKRPWQPLHENQWTDTNGDAFMLVVKLNLAVESTKSVSVVVCADYGNNGYDIEVFELLKDTDPLAATRRAIVRAAAEIGKAMR